MSWRQTELYRKIAASEQRVAELCSRLNKAPVHFDPNYVSQHDVVYLRKNDDWYQGLPFGNGSIGGVVCYGADLRVYLDKTDLWQDVAFSMYDSEGNERKFGSRGGRIHAGVLKISLQGEKLAGGSIEQRIDLLRGRVRILHRCEERELQATVTAHAAGNTVLVEIRHPENLRPKVGLENFACDGSGEDGEDYWIQRSLGYQEYRVLCRRIDTSPCKSTFRISLVSRTENGADLAAAAEALVDEPWDRAAHEEWWSDFWGRSQLCIPDKFIENQWYLAQYVTAAANRASVPPGFYGLWCFSEPIRQWGDMYVTDAQHPFSYWSVLTSNHAELLGPYLELYRDLQSHFERATKELLSPGIGRKPLPGTEMAYLEPGMPYRGMAIPKFFCPPWANLWHGQHGLAHTIGPGKGAKFNATGGWLAQLFWQYYRCTGDREFLAELAYPFMRSALRYVICTLSRDNAGLVYNTCESPEQHRRRGNNNSAFGRALVWRLLKDTISASDILGVDSQERETWIEIFDNLAPYPIAHDGALAESSLQDHPFRAHLSVLAGVYPTREIDADHPLADAAASTLETATKFYADRGPDHRGPLNEEDAGGGELNVFFSTHACLCFTRLGLGDQALGRLYNPALRYLLYSHGGWAHNPGYHPQGPSESTGLPVVPQIVNEMLLQLRREDELYLFPALPEGWRDMVFRNLRVEGGFVVSAEMKDARCLWVHIVSLCGNTLRMRNPFADAYSAEPQRVLESDGEWLVLTIPEAGSLLLVADGYTPEERILGGSPATGPRYFDADEIARRWPIVITPQEPPAEYQNFGDRRRYIGMPAPDSHESQRTVKDACT